ncbi:hypothetical protein [Kribbella italica]|uniref:Ig-like domain-containing protein n=1 Tax=Kribbella italica TaxID=1540520 RepID=A0A7W9J7V5_9ACTN|nr:hypothetical protein [Kribbella italica]MBB5836712.1 hypothetical protein [Kribbella italica]
MNRTLPTLAAAGVLLAAPWVLPTTASAAAPISDVKISWSDATHTKIKVTWTEAAPVANTVEIPGEEPVTVAAGAPNQALLPTATVGRTSADGKHQIAVRGPNGAEARSVEFDSYVYAPPSIQVSFPAYDQLRWTVPVDTAVDGTPNDPLDLPGPTKYEVTWGNGTGDPDPLHGPFPNSCGGASTATTSPTGTIAKPDGPYELIVGGVNEWGSAAVKAVPVDTIDDVSVVEPGRTSYGATTTLTGHVGGSVLDIEEYRGVCWKYSGARTDTTVVVHQRTGNNEPWTVVGTTKTDVRGNYSATFRNPGHRQYRVVVANSLPRADDYRGAIRFGADSRTVAVRSQTRIVSAKFINPVVALGTQPQAYLWADPAGSQRAALQFKNASGAWQGLSYKTLSAGRGLLTFPWNKRGVTQFRWWVPGSPTVDEIYGAAFTLTVR